MSHADDVFVKLDLGSVEECEVFLLPAMTGELDAFLISDLLVTRLTYLDWRMIEKSKYSDELSDAFAGPRTPYFCVFADGALDDSAAEARSAERAHRMRRLTMALRLHTGQPIPDSTDFVRYRRQGPIVTRYPGRFGREGYDIDRSVVLTAVDLATIRKVVHALAVLEGFRDAPRLRRAYRFYWASFDRALIDPGVAHLLLLAAIESLLNRPADLGTVRWDDPAVAEVGAAHSSLRNAVAHGRRIDVDIHDPIRALVGHLLCEATRLELVHPGAGQGQDASLIQSLRDAPAHGSARLNDLSTAVKEEYPDIHAPFGNSRTGSDT
jgi:hypothetical protein